MGGSVSVNTEGLDPKQINAYHIQMSKRIQEQLQILTASGLAGVELDAALESWVAENEATMREEIIASLSQDEQSAEGQTVFDEHEMSKKVIDEELDRIRTKNAHSFLVGVDGSEYADITIENILKLTTRKDFVKVFHSWAVDKQDSLPAHLKYEAVKIKYETAMQTRLEDPSRYDFDLIPREGAATAKESLIVYVDTQFNTSKHMVKSKSNKMVFQSIKTRLPDFFCCGFSGNKNKHLNEEGKPTLMGSTSDIICSTIHLPTILNKKRISDTSLSFVVLVGTSDYSKKAFEIVLSLVKPRDKIYCIHANNGTHDEATLERVTRMYTEEIDLLAPIGSKFVMLQPIGGKDTETTIIDYLNENTDIDGGPAFVAIAPRAREARQAQESGFSSLTKNLMMKVNSNMIIVKHH